jgi:hypothetical protein
MDKQFPIQNSAACVFKWSWVTFYISRGSFNMCHRTGGFQLGDMNFQDFNTHPQLIAERRRMAQNQWPENSCGYCKRIEDASGVSERMVFSKQPMWTPVEFNDAAVGELPEIVTPRIMEVYFKNTCNLACAYCSPMFSSKIEAEINKFGPISHHYNLDNKMKQIDNYEERKAEFWQWMVNHSEKLYFFHVLGGEPFYQQEMQEVIDFLRSKRHPNLTLKVFSNLMHRPDAFLTRIEMLARLVQEGHLKDIQIVCSIDAWGKEQEFARFGINLEMWEQNFKALVTTKGISVSVHSTLCPLTLPTAWVLRQKVIDYSAISESGYIHQSWNIIATPVFFDPCHFGAHMADHFERLLALITDDNALQIVGGFRDKVVSSEVNAPMVIEMRDYLDELSRRRRTQWRSIYPELSDLVDNIISSASTSS